MIKHKTKKKMNSINKLIIDVAIETDLSQFLELQKLAYLQEAKIYYNFDIPPLKQSLKSIKADWKKGVILKAFINKSIVGSVRAYEKEQTCYIGRLLVHPEYQNKGIGKNLMIEIENKFTSAKRFELFTGCESTKNLYFYKNLDYKEFKSEKMNNNLKLIYLKK